MIKHHNFVCQTHDHVHFMFDKTYGNTVIYHLADNLSETLSFIRINPSRWLIEQYQLRVCSKCQRKSNTLLFFLANIGSHTVPNMPLGNKFKHFCSFLGG